MIKSHAIPEQLLIRLSALHALFLLVLGFLLYVVTGCFQLAYSLMSFIVESINYGCLRWRCIEYSYLKESLDFFNELFRNLKVLIQGRKND